MTNEKEVIDVLRYTSPNGKINVVVEMSDGEPQMASMGNTWEEYDEIRAEILEEFDVDYNIHEIQQMSLEEMAEIFDCSTEELEVRDQ